MVISGGGAPQKISSPNVEKILDNDDLSIVHSWVAHVGSHMMYGVTLVASDICLVYDFSTQLWSIFSQLESSGAAKTITGITAAGVVTSATHGLSDGNIILISATNADFNGWYVVMNVTANTFQIDASGTAFSGTGSIQKYIESYFPIVASVNAEGKQYMQDISSGDLYSFDQDVYADYVGATPARIRTPKVDSGSGKNKFMASAELIGDKIPSTAYVRYTDDDYVTYSNTRNIDLAVNRSRIRRLGMYNRRAFEILHVGDALFRMESLEIDE
jgi:hypothetical protein